VLTQWIVGAAERLGLAVQSTSIPGVAQRTGATTYYIEIWPQPARAPDERRPVLALNPGIGDIDLMVASELMEAGRAVVAGFVTPDRTLAIASTARFHVMDEKTAMGDGRYDSERLAKAIAQRSRQHILFDMAEIARRTGTFVNAVMLGAIAGSGRLPIPSEAFEAAICADGKAIEGNLRGFRAGLEAVREAGSTPPAAAQPEREPDQSISLADLERGLAGLPAAARAIAAQGLRRLARYQDLAYARRYLDRLALIGAADAQAQAGGRLLAATARHLALRMSYEDVVKVAEAKIDPARLARIAGELGAQPGEPFTITDFLKPGIEELCSILPPSLARRLLALAERRGAIGRFHWGRAIDSTSVSGFLRFWLIARLRRWRPRSFRFAQEQREIEAWLALIAQAAAHSAELALEIVECARLIKGYGDTLQRGSANYRRIATQLIGPALAGRIASAQAADAIANARTAALLDPEGESLTRCIADIESRSMSRIAAE